MNSEKKQYTIVAAPQNGPMSRQPLKVNIKSKFSALNLKRPAEEVYVPFPKKLPQPPSEKPVEQPLRADPQTNAGMQMSYQMCMQAQAQMARLHKPMVISLPNEQSTGTATLPYKITISMPTEKDLTPGAPTIPLPPLTVPLPPPPPLLPITMPAASVKPALVSISVPNITISSNQLKLLNPIEQIDLTPPAAMQQCMTLTAPKTVSGGLIDREALLLRLNAAFGRLEFLLPTSDDVASLLALAAQDYLKGIIEQIVDIAKHRYASNDFDSTTCGITNDVRGKIEFLNKFCSYLNKREDETMSESLSDIEERRAYKLRKTQEQQIELANQTAMAAIGVNRRRPEEIVPRKMAKKIKVISQDVIFFMENDCKFAKCEMLYKAYEKYD